MTTINEKRGLRRAGKRRMMKLPKNRAAAADLTAAQCPKCGSRGVIENVIHGRRRRMCSKCSEGWDA
jgi:ssDNA-binding Zn-finger/Zn-ribbon topoisomerase 1